jgi:hypothetical protein
MKTYPSLCVHPKEHRITLKRWFTGPCRHCGKTMIGHGASAGCPGRDTYFEPKPEPRAPGEVWLRRYKCPHCDMEWVAWEDAMGEDV